MARENDAEWAKLQKDLLKTMKSSAWGDMAQIYYAQATVVRKEGKEAKHIVAEAVRCELLRMQQASVERVKILGSKDELVCSSSAALDNRILGITEALANMPVPNMNCTASIPRVGDNWCRCCIRAIRLQ